MTSSSSSSCGGGGSGGTACTIIHHVMILVHGIMGNSKELGYVQYALQRDFDTAIQHQQLENNNDNNSVVFPKLLVHSATCNEEDSLDGIEAGGLRLAKEINNLLQDYVQEEIPSSTKEDNSNKDEISPNQQHHVIALSFLGFSLGGMYSRYSLPFIDWNIETPNINKSISVIPNVFVTTATPHLGIQQMTYWKLPTCLEPIVAWYLGQTGRDLFRRPNKRQQQQSAIDNSIVDSIIYKDLIQQMSLDSKFLSPLSKFQKRIAVANAFSTDFAVHTATAAFLTDDDVNDETVLGTMNDDGTDIEQCHSSAHFVVGENNSHDNEEQEAIHGMTTRTETRDKTVHFPTVRFATSRSWSHSDVGHESFSSEISQERYSSCDIDGPSDHDPPQHSDRTCQRPLLHRPTDGSLSDMANSLNSLGWTKVFVDVRSHIPALWSRPKATIKEISFTTQQDQSTSQPTTSTSQSSKVFSPSALKRRLSGKGFDFNTLPFGHSFLVASTKNWWYTWFYKDGRNFVDRFSQELVIECLGMNLDDINNN